MPVNRGSTTRTDAQVKAEALREAAAEVSAARPDGPHVYTFWQAGEWLRNRADAIEASERP